MIQSKDFVKIERSRIILTAISVLVGATNVAGNEPLHAQIDDSVVAGHFGPVASKCSDGEFLRRAYLDLAGTIPSATEARAFIDDPAPNKRAACVDRLLAGPRFPRHMAQIFDVMLMERRRDKYVSIEDWLNYLYRFFDNDRPLDQLFGEVLSADGVDPELRPSARFVLDREADHHVLARDVGRIVFGRDLQCAQCHDHPLIGEYHQRDYYELLAFFSGTKLFTDKDKKVTLIDQSTGEVPYRSVFDDSAEGTAFPRVFGGKLIDQLEVPIDAANGSSIKTRQSPSKTNRRGQLPTEVRRSRQFARNLANRLWAMLLGRGLTDPVDLHHLDNTPVHPRILELLTDELLKRQFRVKSLLREIVLTQTYQRSAEISTDLKAFAVPASVQISELVQQRDNLAKASAISTTASASVLDNLTGTQKQAASLNKDLRGNRAVLTSARNAADEVSKSLRAVEIEREEVKEKSKVVWEASVKIEAAVALLRSEQDLADTSRRFKELAKQFDAKLADLSNQATRLQTAAAEAEAKLKTAELAIHEAEAKLKQARLRLSELEPLYDSAIERSSYDSAVVRLLESRIAGARSLSSLASDSVDAQVVAKTNAELIGRWSREWLVRSLRPLSPEQFAWSAMKAAGVVDAEVAIAVAECDRVMPPSEAVLIDSAARSRQIEQRVFSKLTKNVSRFAELFGAARGQPQHEFFATADQALFFTNCPDIWSWLAPQGDNLTARLMKIDDADSLAEELYLSVYTRLPSKTETTMVTDYLKARGVDGVGKQAEKNTAVRELAWGLLASSEFRFVK